MRCLAISLLCGAVSVTACGGLKEQGQKSMAFDLKEYATAESAKLALEQQLPKGATRDKVLSFLETARIECFDKEANPLACRVIEKSSTMVHVVWQLAFYFDPKRRLENIRVARGLSGP